MDWTRQQEDTLRSLWTEGLTTSQIGARMGLTKNQIIGRAHRMRLPPRASPLFGGGQRVWTDEMLAFVREHTHWSDGKIGDHFGKSAKAVRAARLQHGIGKADVVISRTPGERPLPAPKPKPAPVARVRVAKPVIVAPPKPILLYATTNMASRQYPPQRECQFPFGQPGTKTFRFCCARVTTPGPYCDTHRRKCFIPHQPRDAA